MCRLLVLRAREPFDAAPWIAPFAARCRSSKEYQGHGWGVSWWTGDGWARHRSVAPIWEEPPEALPHAELLIVHARSAFRNEGIVVENNMPFVRQDLAFAFNGELRGVRLSAPGDTGAARLFHLLERFRRVGTAARAGAGAAPEAVAAGFDAATDSGADLGAALERLDRVVTERSAYVRAMNIIVSDGREVWVNSHYSEDPAYFTLHQGRVEGVAGGLRVISSESFDAPTGHIGWSAIPNGVVVRLGGTRTCSS